MTNSTTTLRPGLLVSLKTSLSGNVSYVKHDRAEDIIDGTLKAKWETEKTVIDVAEHERATKVRSKARSLVASVCANSAFGLLCPESQGEVLNKAIADARKLCDEFNLDAKVTRIWFYAITGRVAADDVEAVRAINSEVRDLLADMAEGVEKLDVKIVRDAASKAKQLGSMLTPDAQARIQIAIDAARSSARKIVAAGEQAALEIDKQTLQTLKEARTAFLDIEQEQREIAAPVATGRALDLEPTKSEAA